MPHDLKINSGFKARVDTSSTIATKVYDESKGDKNLTVSKKGAASRVYNEWATCAYNGVIGANAFTTIKDAACYENPLLASDGEHLNPDVKMIYIRVDSGTGASNELDVRVGSSTEMRSLKIGESMTIPFHNAPIGTACYVRDPNYEDGTDELTVTMTMVGDTYLPASWTNTRSFRNNQGGSSGSQKVGGFTQNMTGYHQTSNGIFSNASDNIPVCVNSWVKFNHGNETTCSPFKIYKANDNYFNLSMLIGDSGDSVSCSAWPQGFLLCQHDQRWNKAISNIQTGWHMFSVNIQPVNFDTSQSTNYCDVWIDGVLLNVVSGDYTTWQSCAEGGGTGQYPIDAPDIDFLWGHTDGWYNELAVWDGALNQANIDFLFTSKGTHNLMFSSGGYDKSSDLKMWYDAEYTSGQVMQNRADLSMPAAVTSGSASPWVTDVP